MTSTSHGRPTTTGASTASQHRMLKSEDVRQGSILWLGPHNETLASYRSRDNLSGRPVSSHVTKTDPEVGIYNHPILIISRPAKSPYTIRFLVITQFKKTSLAKRFRLPEDRWERQNWLAISPAEHPLHAEGDRRYQPLRFESSVVTTPTGFVKISEVYEMDWRDAEGSQKYAKATLDAESFRSLLAGTVRLTGYMPPKKQYDARPSTAVGTIDRIPKSQTDLVRSGSNGRGTPSAVEEDSRNFDRSQSSNSPGIDRRRDGIKHVGQSAYIDERGPLLPLHHRPRSSPRFGGSLNATKRACRLVRIVLLAVLVGLVLWLAALGLKYVIHGDR